MTKKYSFILTKLGLSQKHKVSPRAENENKIYIIDKRRKTIILLNAGVSIL